MSVKKNLYHLQKYLKQQQENKLNTYFHILTNQCTTEYGFTAFFSISRRTPTDFAISQFLYCPKTNPYKKKIKKAGSKCLTSKAEHGSILQFSIKDQFRGRATTWSPPWKTSEEVQKWEKKKAIEGTCGS